MLTEGHSQLREMAARSEEIRTHIRTKQVTKRLEPDARGLTGGGRERTRQLYLVTLKRTKGKEAEGWGLGRLGRWLGSHLPRDVCQPFADPSAIRRLGGSTNPGHGTELAASSSGSPGILGMSEMSMDCAVGTTSESAQGELP